jgi:hypothetical protein
MTGAVPPGGAEPVTASVSDPTRISPLEFETVRHSEEPCRTVGQRRCQNGAWLMIRHGSFAPVPVPPDGVCCPSAAAGGPLAPSTPPCRRVVSHQVAASAGSVLGGRAAEAPPPAAAWARRRMSVMCSASQGGRGSCATRACSCSRTWSNRLFGPCGKQHR